MGWDKEDIYDAEFSPLVARLIELSKKHEIPMVAQFQIADTEENGPGFCTTALPLPNACDHMKELAHFVRPRRPVALAETHVTNPDGSKTISIRRVL